LGVSITSTAFISLTTSMGWISCNGLADRGHVSYVSTPLHTTLQLQLICLLTSITEKCCCSNGPRTSYHTISCGCPHEITNPSAGWCLDVV
jgi:hypothetical protein